MSGICTEFFAVCIHMSVISSMHLFNCAPLAVQHTERALIACICCICFHFQQLISLHSKFVFHRVLIRELAGYFSLYIDY